MNRGPYSNSLDFVEKDITKREKILKEFSGFESSDTGLASPCFWDLNQDKRKKDHPRFEVVNLSQVIKPKTPGEKTKYVINTKYQEKYVVGLGEGVAPQDISQGMRVGVEEAGKRRIRVPLPPRFGPTVIQMKVKDKPDVIYDDIGGCKEQIRKVREVVEFPILHPEKYVKLGISPPKGVLFHGPPGTGKTLLAKAVANASDATFIRVLGSELVKRYTGQGSKIVRELFHFARSRSRCIIFFDEIDAIGGKRIESETHGDNEVQRTLIELLNQLDGFSSPNDRSNVIVLMATNRLDVLDKALIRPGRVDRIIHFSPPDMEGRKKIFEIPAKNMRLEKNVRFELIARLCVKCTGADIRSVLRQECLQSGKEGNVCQRRIF